MIYYRKCMLQHFTRGMADFDQRRFVSSAIAVSGGPMFVTHLECSLTGERYDAGKVQNLSRAGKPLLVRYDVEAAKRTLSRESVASRPGGMWKWRELLPLPE